MQLLSAASLSPEAQRLLEDLRAVSVADFRHAALVQIGLALVIAVLAVWIASNVFSKDRAGIGRAILTGLLWLVSFIAVGLLAGFAFFLALRSGSEFMPKVCFVIGTILLLYVVISVPMKVYKIGIFPAIGFIIATAILQAAGNLATERLAGPLGLAEERALLQRLSALPPKESAELFQAIRKAGGPAAAKTIEQRHAELQQMYADLQTRRAALREGDAAALEAYNRENARYVELLQQLQRDAAAQPAPATP